MAILTWTSRLLLALLSGCALSAPPAEDVLAAPSGASDPQLTRAKQALEAFRALPTDQPTDRPSDRPADSATARRAARLLFTAADVTIQRALVNELEALTAPTLADLLAAEEDLPTAVVDPVLALATAGAEAGQAAVDATTAKPSSADHVDAQVHLALNLTFVAWANGPARSLMAGYGSRITSAMRAALEADPTWDGGAPLRLRGRFLCRAPWPLGDAEEGLQLLQQAAELTPLPIHFLFLGDALFATGDREAAAAAWQQVLTAEPDDSTRDVAPFHRRLAQLRLEAAARQPAR